MNGKWIKTYIGCGRYEFEVWAITGERGPCYVTTVRCIPREEGRQPPSSFRTEVQFMLAAMNGATSLANRLQRRANREETRKQANKSPRPSPASRPSPLRCSPPPPTDFANAKSSAEGGCADPNSSREKAAECADKYIEVVSEEQVRRLQEPYRPDPHMSSVVSYPNRCNLWGDARFHGNCDGTLFKDLVLRYQPQSVADPMMGSGTTQDVISGLNRHSGTSIQYWGSDLAKGFNAITQSLPGRFDLVWVHPPYWNIVRYSTSIADLSSCANYDEFRFGLHAALKNCFRALTVGGRLAVLVGDVRRGGRYVPIVRDLLNWEGELGELRSIIIKAQHNVRSNSKQYSAMENVRIQHEYCVIFQRSVEVKRVTEPLSDPDSNAQPPTNEVVK